MHAGAKGEHPSTHTDEITLDQFEFGESFAGRLLSDPRTIRHGNVDPISAHRVSSDEQRLFEKRIDRDFRHKRLGDRRNRLDLGRLSCGRRNRFRRFVGRGPHEKAHGATDRHAAENSNDYIAHKSEDTNAAAPAASP